MTQLIIPKLIVLRFVIQTITIFVREKKCGHELFYLIHFNKRNNDKLVGT